MIKVKCNCKMGEHRAPTERYTIGAGVINELSSYVKDYNKIYTVCDETVYKIVGR